MDIYNHLDNCLEVIDLISIFLLVFTFHRHGRITKFFVVVYLSMIWCLYLKEYFVSSTTFLYVYTYRSRYTSFFFAFPLKKFNFFLIWPTAIRPLFKLYCSMKAIRSIFLLFLSLFLRLWRLSEKCGTLKNGKIDSITFRWEKESTGEIWFLRTIFSAIRNCDAVSRHNWNSC